MISNSFVVLQWKDLTCVLSIFGSFNFMRGDLPISYIARRLSEAKRRWMTRKASSRGLERYTFRFFKSCLPLGRLGKIPDFAWNRKYLEYIAICKIVQKISLNQGWQNRCVVVVGCKKICISASPLLCLMPI